MIPTEFLDTLQLLRLEISDPAKLAGAERVGRNVEFALTLTLPGCRDAKCVHKDIAAIRSAMLQPILDVRQQHADSPEAKKVSDLQKRLDDTLQKERTAIADAETAFPEARKALRSGQDPTPFEQRHREARLEAEVMANRAVALREDVQAAEAESGQALTAKLAAKERELFTAAEEEAAVVIADLIEANRDRLAAVIAAIAKRDSLKVSNHEELEAQVRRDEVRRQRAVEDSKPTGCDSWPPFPEPAAVENPAVNHPAEPGESFSNWWSRLVGAR